jgi:hypothetical protein
VRMMYVDKNWDDKLPRDVPRPEHSKRERGSIYNRRIVSKYVCVYVHVCRVHNVLCICICICLYM